MLLFISAPEHQNYIDKDVSIHHMLLFINRKFGTPLKFNVVSIHHMLLFITNPEEKAVHFFLFQYITCYSLSKRNEQSRRPGWFQYITCYSLSSR